MEVWFGYLIGCVGVLICYQGIDLRGVMGLRIEKMKLKKNAIECISLADLDNRKKEEAKRIPLFKKMEWTTQLREYAYGKKATTGRLRRIYTVAKLGEG